MCGKICKDSKGLISFGDRVLCNILKQGVNGGSIFGSTQQIAHIQPQLCARSETLQDMWLRRGAIFAEPVSPIVSFTEHGQLCQIPYGYKIQTIIHMNWWDRYLSPMDWLLKVVTRDDGWTYRRVHGKYPDGVNSHMADMEHSLHHRWPVYIPTT